MWVKIKKNTPDFEVETIYADGGCSAIVETPNGIELKWLRHGVLIPWHRVLEVQKEFIGG